MERGLVSRRADREGLLGLEHVVAVRLAPAGHACQRAGLALGHGVGDDEDILVLLEKLAGA